MNRENMTRKNSVQYKASKCLLFRCDMNPA